MAAQGYAEGQSVTRPPFFEGEDYQYWKMRMECFIRGTDFDLWQLRTIYVVLYLKKNLVEYLHITYEGTDKVKQTRIDILVSQYEQFKMFPNENITQMYNRFSSIVVGLSSLGKNLSDEETVRKILRSLTISWTPKVTSIEEAHDLTKLSIDNLIGSLMAHEINMERLSESSSKKKCTNALKVVAAPSTSSSSSKNADSEDSDVDEVLSKLQKIFKKKKNGSKRIQKKNRKEKEPVCYECRKPGHLRPDCPRLKKTEFSRVSACKSAKEIWDKLQITYEGTDKVKQTRIDILVSQYEQFKMFPNENITQMYNRFSSSLMAHEINMERLSESSSKKKCTNALKVVAAPSTSSSCSKNAYSEDSDVDEVLSKLQKIFKKKKNGSKRIQKKNRKEKEPVCYKCRKPGHLRPDCPRLKKTGQNEKPKKKHKKFKRKGMAAAWENEETTCSESSSSESEKEQSAATSMDAYSELAAIDVDVYLPDLLRFQTRKRLRKCCPWFRKPFPNGNPALPNFVSDPSSIKHLISGQI
ncbi:hypothetical protein Taro_003319 [Colocasia esculenta]|uniref:CCHC-type domain-containing protein n=1 Tax=Colocasia esculenta TaxID=4460 RepID=A0A843TL95_COLES|nr:hypothetical protein [Colocasia esculenta]